MCLPRPLQILLVEDNLINQRVASRILEKEGHSVAFALNGREALASLEDNTFDLVLMDVQMPEMDGIQATEEIRAREAGGDRRMPIVALTANTQPDDRDRCRQAGMDGFVPKPVRAPELFQVMADALGEQLQGQPAGE